MHIVKQGGGREHAMQRSRHSVPLTGARRHVLLIRLLRAGSKMLLGQPLVVLRRKVKTRTRLLWTREAPCKIEAEGTKLNLPPAPQDVL